MMYTLNYLNQRRKQMAFNPGPTYNEWLEVINHRAHHSFDDLKAIAERIEEEGTHSRLTSAQRADLLRRLGDLQIAAANHAAKYDGTLNA